MGWVDLGEKEFVLAELPGFSKLRKGWNVVLIERRRKEVVIHLAIYADTISRGAACNTEISTSPILKDII